jgi:hypothetical protein
VSLSSTQAEVEALVELVKEITWFQGFLESIDITIKLPTSLYTDNQSAIALSDEGNHLRRSKHYVVRTAYLREQVEAGNISINHIAGTENPTDLFTKALNGKLLLRPIHRKLP